jgi:hypothetical protein
MRYIYDFHRDEDIEQYSGQFTESVSTQIRGEDVVLDSFFSGVESFSIACGFTLNGSGIGLVAKPD